MLVSYGGHFKRAYEVDSDVFQEDSEHWYTTHTLVCTGIPHPRALVYHTLVYSGWQSTRRAHPVSLHSSYCLGGPLRCSVQCSLRCAHSGAQCRCGRENLMQQSMAAARERGLDVGEVDTGEADLTIIPKETTDGEPVPIRDCCFRIRDCCFMISDCCMLQRCAARCALSC